MEFKVDTLRTKEVILKKTHIFFHENSNSREVILIIFVLEL
jgi:hypothetical protein